MKKFIVVKGDTTVAVEKALADLLMTGLHIDLTSEDPLVHVRVDYVLDFDSLDRLAAALKVSPGTRSNKEELRRDDVEQVIAAATAG